MPSDLLTSRTRRRALGQSLVVALTVAFYVALVPLAVVLSGPVYEALECTFGECRPEGTRVLFALPTRGPLRTGSSIRLANGDPIGEIAGFEASASEHFTWAVGLLDEGPRASELLTRPLRCVVNANFNIEMDGDLVVSACPGLDLPAPPRVEPDSALRPAGMDQLPVLVCGTVDHFERMGQELRRFVLQNVRPGEYPEEVRLSGPCGADNEATTARLRQLLTSR